CLSRFCFGPLVDANVNHLGRCHVHPSYIVSQADRKWSAPLAAELRPSQGSSCLTPTTYVCSPHIGESQLSVLTQSSRIHSLASAGELQSLRGCPSWSKIVSPPARRTQSHALRIRRHPSTP